MHLTGLFETVVLEEKIAVVASLGIILGLFDDRSVTYDKGKTCHCHEALLRGSHAEIDIVFFDVDRAHCIGAGCINGKDCAVLVSQSTDLTDGIKDTCSSLIVSRVNELNVRVVLECFLNNSQIRTLVYGELQIYMRKSVELADLNSSGAVSAVVYYEDLTAFRKQGIYADIDIDCA